MLVRTIAGLVAGITLLAPSTTMVFLVVASSVTVTL